MTTISQEKTKVVFFRDEFLQGIWKRPDPLLTVDYNSQTNRIVTAGIQTDIKVWEVSYTADDVLFRLVAKMNPIYDSAKVVNIARWSPCGNYIATGCGRGAVIVWKKKGMIEESNQPKKPLIQDDETDLSFIESDIKPTEEWMIVRRFGGEEGEDIWDLSWSPPLIDHKTGRTTYLLATTSMDRRLKVYQPLESYEIIFEYFSDVSSSIGGVTWDPLGFYLAIQLSVAKKALLFGLNQDRFSIFGPRQEVGEAPKKKKKGSNSAFEKVGSIKKSSKDNKDLFQGDNHTIQYRSTVLNSVRRLSFSPDGSFLITTAGQSNTLHMFYRNMWKKPFKCIGGLSSTSPIVRFSPILYKSSNPNSKLPYRMMACASSKDEVIVFDTETDRLLFRSQRLFAQAITDVSWNSDGTVLLVSSQEGLVGIFRFDKDELGEKYDILASISSSIDSASPLEQHISRIGEINSKKSESLQKILSNLEEKPQKEEQVNHLVPKKRIVPVAVEIK